MQNSNANNELENEDQQFLLSLARRTIELSATGETAALPAVDELPPALRERRATFVTLHRNGELRGCCGSLQAFEPLAWNVSRSARAAACSDKRFLPVQPREVPELELHISVLGDPVPIRFVTEADLVSQLRPGVDGVILVEQDLSRQGVFLPSVWGQLPDRWQFVRRLKQKAGLPPDYWSPWMRAERFTVKSIPSESETC